MRWEGLTRFLDDNPIKLDNSPVECSIRPTILNPKSALFAGSELCAVIALVIETCKLNDVDPLA
jgi:transposase